MVKPDQANLDKAFKTLNAYRAFANAAPVRQLPDNDPAWTDSQEGAISMAGAYKISHGLKPAGDYPCRTDGGINSTNSSILAIQWGGVETDHFSGLIDDSGYELNERTLGHRMQVLEPTLGQTAMGIAVKDSTQVFSMLTLETASYDGKLYTNSKKAPVQAWPAPGFFPYDLLPKVHWSFRTLEGEDITGAQVQIFTPQGETWNPETETISFPGYPVDKDRIKFKPDMSRIHKPLPQTYDTYTVKITLGEKTWTYPIKLFKDIKLQNPTYEPNLPAELKIPEGGSKQISAGVKGFPDFTWVWNKYSAASGEWTNLGTSSAPTLSASPTLTVSDADYDTGDRLSLKATQEGTDFLSRTMTITVVPKPTVSLDHNSDAIIEGDSAREFTATTNNPENEVVWYRLDGTGRTKVGEGLTFTPTDTAVGEYTYEAEATSPYHPGKSATAQASLEIVKRIAFSTQPEEVAVIEGGEVEFSVAHNGDSLKWQKSTDKGATWEDVPDATGDALKVAVTSADADVLFRTVITGPLDQTLASEPASVKIYAKLKSISIVADKTDLVEGDSVTFTATTEPTAVPGDLTTPQVSWEYAEDGENFVPVPDNDSLTFSLSDLKAADDGMAVRSVLRSKPNQQIYSDPVVLTVASAPVFTTPKGAVAGSGLEDDAFVFEIEEGKDFQLLMEASANPEVSEFTWYHLADGEWVELPIVAGAATHAGVVSKNSPSLFVSGPKVVNGAKYRLSAKNSVGTSHVWVTLKVTKASKPISGTIGGNDKGDTTDKGSTGKPILHSTGKKGQPGLAATGYSTALGVGSLIALLLGGLLVQARRRQQG